MSFREPSVIGLFGGTFDPPHFGHIALANSAAAALGLNELVLIPAGNPNFKRDATFADARDRLVMCALAAQSILACPARASDIEIARGGVTFTIDTVREIMAKVSTCTRLIFILGQDAFETLPKWRAADELASLVEFAVVPRSGGIVQMPNMPGLRAQVINADPPAISSTEIRALIAAGQDVSDYLPAAVYDYIKARKLYIN